MFLGFVLARRWPGWLVTSTYGCDQKSPGRESDHLPSGKLTKNYGTSPFLMGKIHYQSPFFNSYVKLPEGTSTYLKAASSPQKVEDTIRHISNADLLGPHIDHIWIEKITWHRWVKDSIAWKGPWEAKRVHDVPRMTGGNPWWFPDALLDYT